ncbi:hypothetical protein MPSEU_000600300 [Mayamaea pseudoterrestris]|nr:hypothetical protein MPSEU_000600300 [Mayamaea pseudoterrestris]
MPKSSPRPSLDEHFAKKEASSTPSDSKTKKDWDDASGNSLGDLSLDADIQAMSRETHALLNQILNDTSESNSTTPTKSKSPRRKKGGENLDTSYDNEELEEELHRVDDVSDGIRALSAELNAVGTNERGEVIAAMLPAALAADEHNQLELLESVELTCTPRLYRNNDVSSDGTKMVRFDPAVEQLKALRVAISNKDIAPVPPRGRALKKELPGRLEEGVDQVILFACIIIWTVIVIIVDHTRMGMMNHDEGTLQHPWIFRLFCK